MKRHDMTCLFIKVLHTSPSPPPLSLWLDNKRNGFFTLSLQLKIFEKKERNGDGLRYRQVSLR